jgi:murein DD-endopeptidase MepM/ murein hydrolase activator NlpD
MKIAETAAAAIRRGQAGVFKSLGRFRSRKAAWIEGLRARAQALGLAWRKRGAGLLLRLRGISRRKLTAGLLTGALVFAAALGTYIYRQGFGYALVVDGQEIGFLTGEDREAVESFLQELAKAAALNYDAQVVQNQKVDFVRERRPGEHVSLEPVQDELQMLLSFSVYGYALMVNGLETVVLASEQDVVELEDLIRNMYSSEYENSILRRAVIQEDLQSLRTLVSPDAIACVEEAAHLLVSGMNRQQTYLVARGDSLSSIARKQNMSLTDLKKANPQITSNVIRPGDQLNLVVMVPLVNVSVVEELTVHEKIPFTTQYTSDSSMYTNQTRVVQAGAQGERLVTYQLTRENGREIDRRILQSDILKEPVAQVVARGTKRRPFESLGRFAWPIPIGVGTLTSPFGWRGGSMHYGVDIAAPVGTAIKAAESGVVITSAYRGSYGNLVIISHSNGYSTYYAHNSRNLVAAGQKVGKGQTIALVGSTGNSTGPHVHFEIRRDGTPINPMNFFRR